jgi:phage terminase large subunit-like protein
MDNKQELRRILLKGTPQEKKALFGFNSTNTNEEVQKKFKLFSTNYGRYFAHNPAPFHDGMVLKYIKSYRGELNYLNIGYRGCAKTTLLKLFTAFVLLNDEDHSRKFLKVLTKDGANSKQVVTDVYNLMVEVQPIYGNVFENDTKKKREETMASFTMTSGVKLAASTVGKTQRGQVQDAFRPDWIWFDDIEDRDSADSPTITQNIINKVDEAIQGLSVSGSYVCTANYITDIGVIENLKSKSVETEITPIIDEQGEPTWDYFSKEKITNIRLDAEDWYGEYMCDPVTGANREFKAEYFQSIKMAEVMAKTTRLFLTIDSAVKKDEGADYSGFTLNFVCGEGKWHFKSWREHLNTGELIDKIFELWAYWKPKGLEKVGLEETMAVVAIMPFLEDEMRKRNVFIPVVMLKHGGTKKETRIRGLIPRYTSNSIFHIEGECKDLEGELLRFPSIKNDDTMDAAAYQDQIAEKPHAQTVVHAPPTTNFERFGVGI